jgi:para-nitrobenzyl esterase
MRSFRYIALAVVVLQTLCGSALAQGADEAVVRTEAGSVQGVKANGVLSYKGIPYAAPPVGDLRWSAPQRVKTWKGERMAEKFGPECMQADDVPKSEDCLTLNVWKPADTDDPLPVMVWIYGGGLVHGQTSLYPADNLAKQGVIVVSMNYRMNRFGFFAHPALLKEQPSELHGNYGYMDQRAALQWIQRNIAKFGGDPKNVTLFGESAGGGSVLTHLTSPRSRGLFHRAILESPGIPTPRAKVVGLTGLAAAQQTAVDYAKSVGIKGYGRKSLKALRALPAETLAEGTGMKFEIPALATGKLIPGVAGSIIDGKLVVETPEAAVIAGRWAKVPIIIGANDRDLPIGIASSKDELFANFGPYTDAARKLYDPNGAETVDELKQQVFADKTMTEPARHLADLVTRGGGTAYLYRFSYIAESLRGNPAWKGTPHAMEIPYTFDLPAAIVKDKVTATDKKMAEIASGYWISFAKTGDPNGRDRPPWLKYQPGVDAIINFTNSGVTVGPDPIKARLDLWEKAWSRDR